MIIAKFGGTSVSSKERVLTLCNIVANEQKRKPVVVVSALSSVTDLLLSLPSLSKPKVSKTIKQIYQTHQNLIEKLWSDKSEQDLVLEYISNQLQKVTEALSKKNNTKQFKDKLVCFGEIMSSFIIAKALESRGIKAAQVIATKLIVTDDQFGSAEFLPKPTKINIKKELIPFLKKGITPVVTGFIASNTSGQATTLGRGGSDYTASIIGFCLDASEIQIWTDVDGIYNADPKVIKKAKPLPVVSFREAAELATFGAKILHPRTIRPAVKMGIPVKVLNTFNPEGRGTLIVKRTSYQKRIKAISYKRKITLVNIYSTEMLLQKGFLAKVFTIFAQNNISIDLVSVSEVSISVTLDNKDNLHKATKVLSQFTKVTVMEDLGMVSLIGGGITDSAKIIKNIFDILGSRRILAKMVSLGATNVNISIVIDSDKVEKAVKFLHSKLINGQMAHNLQESGTISSK